MSVPPPPPDGLRSPAPAEQGEEFYRWSCDVLLGQVTAQIERRRALDAKAAQVIAAVAAVVLWSVTSIEKPASGGLLVGLLLAYPAQFFFGSASIWKAFRALQVADSNCPNPRALTIDDDEGVPLEGRWRGIRDHLTKSEQEARQGATDKVPFVKSAEAWAMWAIPAGVIAGFLARIAVAFAPPG